MDAPMPCPPRWTRLSASSVTAVGAGVNIGLSALKLGAGLASGSTSLIADAGHSCGDLLSDGICMLATIAPRWEHGCTVGIGLMLLSTGAAMIASSASALVACCATPALASVTAAAGAGGAALAPAASALDAAGLVALAVAVVSIASKEALFRVTHAIGTRRASTALVANAHHHRSDAYSSIAAVLGIGGAMCGFSALDPLAAVVVGGMVVKLGAETTAGAWRPGGHCAGHA